MVDIVAKVERFPLSRLCRKWVIFVAGTSYRLCRQCVPAPSKQFPNRLQRLETDGEESLQARVDWIPF